MTIVRPCPDGKGQSSANLPAGDLLCSVIVPVYNGGQVIEACLDALACQTVAAERYEVIIVDDGSTDDTAARVTAWANAHPSPVVTLLRQANAGPAAARNRGAQVAQAWLLLFTDADCCATPQWIEALVGPFAGADPPAGAMGTYASGQKALASRFAQWEFEDRYRRMAGRSELDVVATYSAAFRRDVFLAAGGFDPAFPEANNEDVEFSYRLSKSGQRMLFVPEAQVYHRHAGAWLDYARTKLRRGYWRTLVYRRYPDKALKDSYTPQVLKLQILLAPLVPLGGLLALARRSLGWLGLAAPFVATTLPFVRFVARRDPAAALWAAWGLWLRSIVFGLGVIGGLLARTHKPAPGDDAPESPPP